MSMMFHNTIVIDYPEVGAPVTRSRSTMMSSESPGLLEYLTYQISKLYCTVKDTDKQTDGKT